MQCSKPIYVHPVGEVPCGKCAACRINRTKEWAVRLMQECSQWEHSCFLTLTYNKENLPEDGSLSKRELQLFFKRLRFDLKGRKIKYYACGEYGDRFLRPHYHAIIFGIDCEDEYFEKLPTPFGKPQRLKISSWPFGFVVGGNVTYESARYVAGYVQKKKSGIMAGEEYGTKERPFQTQSQGIGKKFVLANENYLISNMGMTVNGIKHSLPRYYIKVLGDKITPEMMDAKRWARETELKAWLEERGIPIEEAKRYMREFRAQKAAELEFRLNRFKKRNY